MTTFHATYENGVLRPTEKLPFDEGETVEVTVTSERQTLSEQAIANRIRSASTLQEWVKATELLPSDDGGIDFLKDLDENRRRNGERPFLVPKED